MDSAHVQKFECPVCNEYFVKPVYQCPTGHSFCAPCKQRLDKCPFCMQTFGDTRNYSLEGIIDNVKLKCRNAACPELVWLHEYAQHDADCEYSRTPCLVPKCKWNASAAQLNAHIRDAHPSMIVQPGSMLKPHQLAICVLAFEQHLCWMRRYVDEKFTTWTAQLTQSANVKLLASVRIIMPDGDWHVLAVPCSTKVADTEEKLQMKNILSVITNKMKGAVFQVALQKAE